MDSQELSLLQAIREIIKDEVRAVIKDEVRAVVKDEVKEIKNDINDIKKRLDKVEFEVVKTNISIENQILPLVQVIKEGYDGQRDKLNDIKQTVDKMAP